MTRFKSGCTASKLDCSISRRCVTIRKVKKALFMRYKNSLGSSALPISIRGHSSCVLKKHTFKPHQPTKPALHHFRNFFRRTSSSHCRHSSLSGYSSAICCEDILNSQGERLGCARVLGRPGAAFRTKLGQKYHYFTLCFQICVACGKNDQISLFGQNFGLFPWSRSKRPYINSLCDVELSRN